MVLLPCGYYSAHTEVLWFAKGAYNHFQQGRAENTAIVAPQVHRLNADA